jgi:D-aminopeptidase
LSNFGRQQDLLLDGTPAGHLIEQWTAEEQSQATGAEGDKGSILIILATDIPLSERQLKRVCKRAAVGIARTGSFIGNGSGDIVLGFTTANRIPHVSDAPMLSTQMLHEDEIDLLFRAAAEATEESIYNSMICASTTTGRAGNTRVSLQTYIERLLEHRASHL